MHQCLFSPTIDTLCKAIDNDQLIGFPHLTSALVRKYLPESTATAKGHMKRLRQHTRSTTKNPSNEDIIDQDFRPPANDKAEVELFIGATIGEQNDGTIYSDQTGAFPVQSFHGKKSKMILYEYRSNAILCRALKSQSDESMVDAFNDVYEELASKGFKPKLHIMDNQCSKAVVKQIKAAGVNIQLVPPDEHKVNAAERAIQTWKDHWTAGMGTLDPNCPMQLWCQFIDQAQLTLNLLRTSRINPKLSAYAVLYGQFNFNKTPLAPVGTKALVFLDPGTRNSWQNHADDAFYVGPAMKHYRNYRVFIPETRSYRITNTLKLYPAHCKMPAIEPGATLRLAAQDLIAAIKNLKKTPIDLKPRFTAALRQLSSIFNESIDEEQEEQPVPRVPTNNSAPRVATNNSAPRVSTPSTSHNPTSPRVLAKQPRIHQRQTRRNTPMPVIHEESPQAMQRIRTRDNKSNKQPQQAQQQQVRPRRSIANYQRQKAAIISVTPEKLSDTPSPLPNYISQDEEEPQHSPYAGLMKATRRTQVHSTKTPCNITSAAIYKLMGQHLEDKYSNAYIPNKFDNSPVFSSDIALDQVANAVVHPVTKETITKYEKLANDPVLSDTWCKAKDDPAHKYR